MIAENYPFLGRYGFNPLFQEQVFPVLILSLFATNFFRQNFVFLCLGFKISAYYLPRPSLRLLCYNRRPDSQRAKCLWSPGWKIGFLNWYQVVAQLRLNYWSFTLGKA